MTTKAVITLSEEVIPPTDKDAESEIRVIMNIDYEIDKDEEGNVLVRSNLLGMSRIILELFRYGIIDRMGQAFVPAERRVATGVPDSNE